MKVATGAVVGRLVVEQLGARLLMKRGAGWVVMGPLALGVVTGLSSSVEAMVDLGVGFVAVSLGVTLLMAPALYLMLTLSDAAISLNTLGCMLTNALRAAGQVHLGLTSAALFLVMTTPTLRVEIPVANSIFCHRNWGRHLAFVV